MPTFNICNFKEGVLVREVKHGQIFSIPEYEASPIDALLGYETIKFTCWKYFNIYVLGEYSTGAGLSQSTVSLEDAVEKFIDLMETPGRKPLRQLIEEWIELNGRANE
jgi:hypothetical protein